MIFPARLTEYRVKLGQTTTKITLIDLSSSVRCIIANLNDYAAAEMMIRFSIQFSTGRPHCPALHPI